MTDIHQPHVPLIKSVGISKNSEESLNTQTEQSSEPRVMSIYYSSVRRETYKNSLVCLISTLSTQSLHEQCSASVLTLLGLVVPVLALKVPVVVGDVLVVVIFSALSGVELITNLMVLVAVKSLLSKSEAVSRFKMLPTFNATEALEMSFQFRITL